LHSAADRKPVCSTDRTSHLLRIVTAPVSTPDVSAQQLKQYQQQLLQNTCNNRTYVLCTCIKHITGGAEVQHC